MTEFMNDTTFIAGLLACAAGLIGYSLWPRRPADREAVLRRMGGGRAGERALRGTGPRENTARRMAQKVATAAKPVMPRSEEEMSRLRVRLANAGYRGESAATIFLASKTILGVGCAGIGLAVGLGVAENNVQLAGIAMFGGGIGMMLPNVWLSLAASDRATKIREGLPDTLDLLVISVEAGLGLDAALLRVAEEMNQVHPILAEELLIATTEARMGVPRAEALEHLAARTGVSEMRSLVAVINQAERFGTSIAKALRNQAQVLRTKRRQKAEERAQKTAVKLMVPLVLFIFPAIFIVLVGPAALQLMRTFGNR